MSDEIQHTHNDTAYIPASERAIIADTDVAGGWSGPLDMELDLLDSHAVSDSIARDLAQALRDTRDALSHDDDHDTGCCSACFIEGTHIDPALKRFDATIGGKPSHRLSHRYP